MNLLISLPAGILLIMTLCLLLARYTKSTAYAIGGLVALMVIMVYGMLAAISWPGADVFAIHIALYLLTVYGMTIVAAQRQKKLTQGSPSGVKSKLHWAPVTLFVFFGIILVTDSVLILLAQSGMNPEWARLILPEPRGKGTVRSVFPGTVSHDFREKSSQFNQYKEQREQQAELGWAVNVGWKNDAYSNVVNTLFVEIKQRDGSYLSNAEVTARFLYPANTKYDQVHTLSSDSLGLYRSDVTLANPGDWDMVLTIRHKNGEYEMRTRTTIQQANE